MKYDRTNLFFKSRNKVQQTNFQQHQNLLQTFFFPQLDAAIILVFSSSFLHGV